MKGDHWKKSITTNEAWFYLTIGKRSIFGYKNSERSDFLFLNLTLIAQLIQFESKGCKNLNFKIIKHHLFI